MYIRLVYSYVMAQIERTPRETKAARRNLRVSERDDALICEAAALAGTSVSEFMVDSAKVRAQMLLADRTQFSLPRPAWDELQRMLDEPPRVIAELERLVRTPSVFSDE